MRIFIASADKTFRLALLMLLESEPGMVVVGLSDRSEGLPVIVGASDPDVLLLDNGITVRATAQLVSDLHQLERRPKIIMLSTGPQVESAALETGADAFVSKSYPADVLLSVLKGMRFSADISK